MDKAISYILAIAEKKSISEAAKALYISQPSLSRYLSTLEKSLGVSLFQRTVEGTTLTEAGEQYVYYARAIQENYRALEKAMQEQRQGQSRSLRICTCLSAVTLTTQELIHAYEKKIRRSYPAHPQQSFERSAGPADHRRVSICGGAQARQSQPFRL